MSRLFFKGLDLLFNLGLFPLVTASFIFEKNFSAPRAQTVARELGIRCEKHFLAPLDNLMSSTHKFASFPTALRRLVWLPTDS